jgi:hypothetical protein
MTDDARILTERVQRILAAIRSLPSDKYTGHALLAIGVGLLRAEGVESDAVRCLVDETLKGGDRMKGEP